MEHKKGMVADDTSRFMTEDLKRSCLRRHQSLVLSLLALPFFMFALYLIIVAPSAGTWPLN